MGPKHCKTKHMENLGGTTSDPGWDMEGLDGTPRDSNRLLGLSEPHKRSKPMGFKIASSGDSQNSQFWSCLGGSLAPTRVSQPMVFKTASSGDFQNSQF